MARRDGGLLAVDIGTSAIKVSHFTFQGEVAASHRVRRTDGHAGRFNAAEMLADLHAAVRGTTERSPLAVAAVGVCGLGGVVFLDRDHRPVEPAADWSDTRGVDRLRERWTTLGHADRTGRSQPHSSALALIGHLDRASLRVAGPVTVASPKDAAVAHLTGRVVTDPTSAAYTLLYDVYANRWSDTAPDLLGTGVRLPEVVASTSIVGGVTTEAAQLTGIPAGTPVVAGGPDGTVGVLGCVGVRPGIVDIAGTTDVLASVSPTPPASSRAAVVNPFVIEHHWTRGGSTGPVPVLTPGALDDAVVVSTDQPLVITRSQLARFPFWFGDHPPLVSRAFMAADDDEKLIHAHRSAGYLLRACTTEIVDRGPVLMAGGITRNSAAVQARADALGQPVVVIDDADASLRGCAMLAALGISNAASVTDQHDVFASPTRLVDPRDQPELEQHCATWDAIATALPELMSVPPATHRPRR